MRLKPLQSILRNEKKLFHLFQLPHLPMYTERPWLFDDFDAWRSRLAASKPGGKPPYKCAVIFCDNSGVDIILGVFPFVRQLLSMGTNVSLQYGVLRFHLMILANFHALRYSPEKVFISSSFWKVRNKLWLV